MISQPTIQASWTAPMALLRLKYVNEFKDRHGAVRRYFRRGKQCVPLVGLPGSDEFMESYRAALAGLPASKQIGASRTLAGTIGAAVASYYQSAEYAALAKSTQATYRGLLEQIRGNAGDAPLASLQRRHVRAMMASKGDKTTAANNMLRAIRLLVKYAISMEMIEADATHGIKAIKKKSGGFHTWTEAEIKAYEKRHPVGTRARLAMDLLLYTGQRRGDVIGLGRGHIKDGQLHLTQNKTGAAVSMPVHPALAESIRRTPSGHMNFLVTSFGKPFTAAGFGNLFRQWCNEAGLPKKCSAHGLRKAMSRRLAEASATPNQIKAVTGHQTLTEVNRYTEAANKESLAKEAMRKITPRRRK
jgi:integrase